MIKNKTTVNWYTIIGFLKLPNIDIGNGLKFSICTKKHPNKTQMLWQRQKQRFFSFDLDGLFSFLLSSRLSCSLLPLWLQAMLWELFRPHSWCMYVTVCVWQTIAGEFPDCVSVNLHSTKDYWKSRPPDYKRKTVSSCRPLAETTEPLHTYLSYCDNYSEGKNETPSLKLQCSPWTNMYVKLSVFQLWLAFLCCFGQMRFISQKNNLFICECR